MAETIEIKASTEFEAGMETADIVREAGLGATPMPQKTFVLCDCGTKYEKKVLIDECPNCHMTYVVSPESAHSPEYVMAAGIDYGE